MPISAASAQIDGCSNRCRIGGSLNGKHLHALHLRTADSLVQRPARSTWDGSAWSSIYYTFDPQGKLAQRLNSTAKMSLYSTMSDGPLSATDR